MLGPWVSDSGLPNACNVSQFDMYEFSLAKSLYVVVTPRKMRTLEGCRVLISPRTGVTPEPFALFANTTPAILRKLLARCEFLSRVTLVVMMPVASNSRRAAFIHPYDVTRYCAVTCILEQQ